MKSLLWTVLLAGTVLAQSPAPDLKASMVVLGVSDLSRSVDFYKQILGLTSAPAPGDLPMFRAGNLLIVLNQALSGSSGAFELVFTVDSVGSVRNQLASRGCRFVSDSKEVAKGIWAATFADPDGHRLTLFGPR